MSTSESSAENRREPKRILGSTEWYCVLPCATRQVHDVSTFQAPPSSKGSSETGGLEENEEKEDLYKTMTVTFRNVMVSTLHRHLPHRGGRSHPLWPPQESSHERRRK